ncbi:response regulator [Alsobacter sp. R-9]
MAQLSGSHPDGSAEARTAPAPSRRPQVLLVEDEALLRETTQEGLEEEGFAVIAAPDGEAALGLMRQYGKDIDWLFTDIRLPGTLGGWHVAFEFRFLHPLRPVLYATAYADDLPPMVSGSVVLRKPYVLSEVVEALQRLDEALGSAAGR